MTLLAIFDVDGTLVDSQHHIAAAMDHAHESAGMDRLPRERVLEIVGLSLPEAFRVLHPGLDETSAAALVAGYRSAFSALRDQGGPARGEAPLYPGVGAGLARLAARRDMLLGTATGKSRRGLRAMIEGHGLHGTFATLQCADDHPSKPHPSMVLAALAETGSAAERAVMIGDTEFDMAMGRAAGVRCIAVTWGYHRPDRLRAAGATHLVDDWDGLESLLAELAG